MTANPIKAASRTHEINPFRVMTVLERAKQLEVEGRKIVHLEVGEPDFSTAKPIVEAAHAALEKGYTHYSNAAGLPKLREAISQFYSERYQVEVNPRRIFITPGASGGLNLLANLLVDSGDGILMADPAYPCNRNYVRLMEADAQMVKVGAESGFQPNCQILEGYLKPNTRGLWLASPANPTGAIISREQLTKLNDWARRNGLHVVMDEIYQGLHYVDEIASLLQLTDQGFVVNSFSKYFGMTGWRVGWIVVPDQFTHLVDVLSQNLFIAASTISQYAALSAFMPGTIEILEHRRSIFRQRRDFLCQALQEIGFAIPTTTDGAFYIYADISKFSQDSEEFCQRLLEDHGVAATPGTDFGEFQAKRYVRFAFTTDMDNLKLGVERLQKALTS